MAIADVALRDGYLLRLQTVQVSQSQANNTTQLDWSLYIQKGPGAGKYAGGPHYWGVTIDGQDRSGSIGSYDFRNYDVLPLGSGRLTIAHNANGTKTVSGSGSFNDNDSYGEIGDGTVGPGPLIALTRIPKTPGAPTSLTNGTVTATSVPLSWTAPSDNGGASITEYQVQRATNSGFTTNTASITFTGTGTSSKSVTGLSNGTTYYFRVRARNSIGYGAWSNTRTATTLGAPGAPTGLSAGTLTATSATLAWTTPGSNGGASITEYRVQRATNSAFTTDAAYVTFSGTGTTGKVVAGLANRTQYYFRVQGRNSVGYGAWSSVVTGTTLGVPDKPAVSVTGKTTTTISCSVANGSYTGGTITARESQRSTSSSFATVQETSTTTPFTASGLTRGTTYYFRSRVQNATGWSAWSNTLTVATDTAAPSAPTGYTATNIASESAYYSMPAVSDNGGATLTMLRVQYNTAATDAGATTLPSDGYFPRLMDDLEPGTTYYFRLAVSNGQWSAYGAWVSFTTRSDVPGAPGNFSVDSITGTTATATWEAPANLYGSELFSYTLRVAQNAGFGSGLQTYTVDPGEVSQIIGGLSPGLVYYVQLWAVSSAGVGSMTPVISFQTEGAAPSQDGLWLKVDGTWRNGPLWQKVAGVWRQGTLWQKVAGVWRQR